MRRLVIVVLNRLPLLKRLLRRLQNQFISGGDVSSHYSIIKSHEVGLEGQRLRNSWQDHHLPRRQRHLVDQQLKRYRLGASVDVFDVFVNSLRGLPNLHGVSSLLEVGCSSGFYSEVVNIARLPIAYSGCDYSEEFIHLAREMYPSLDFKVEDATDLHYPDGAFDIVLSGCCLLHIPEFERAVEETARVARLYAIFHRTPVVWGRPNQWYRKKAYGIETVEIHFNEPEFLSLLMQNGLELIETYTLSEEACESNIVGKATRTYVCRKTLI